MTSYRFGNDPAIARALQQEAREQMKLRLLQDIRIDIEVSRLEGWDYQEYLEELKETIEQFL